MVDGIADTGHSTPAPLNVKRYPKTTNEFFQSFSCDSFILILVYKQAITNDSNFNLSSNYSEDWPYQLDMSCTSSIRARNQQYNNFSMGIGHWASGMPFYGWPLPIPPQNVTDRRCDKCDTKMAFVGVKIKQKINQCFVLHISKHNCFKIHILA